MEPASLGASQDSVNINMPEAAPIKKSKKSTTLGAWSSENQYVEKLLPCLRISDPNVTITRTERSAHTVFQTLMQTIMPASTLPIFYKNPHSAFLGMAFGAGFGAVLALTSPAPPMTELKNIQQWAERLAGATTNGKIGVAAAHSLVSIGNTLANVFVEGSNEYTILQGSVPGVYIGYTVTWLAIAALHQISQAQQAKSQDSGQAPAVDEKITTV